MSRRVPLATLAALLASAVFGCLDAIAPGPGRASGASVRLLPVFEGAAGGVPGDVDLIRLTIHDPPSPDTTIDRSVAPGQVEITVAVPLTLNSTLDSVVVRFQAIRSSDSTVLYSGTDTIAVAAGISATATPIVAAYVGPGRNILSIAIAPAAVTLPPGDSVGFSFTALDSSLAVIAGMPALFASRNTGVMTVNASGVGRAVAEGVTYVVVTSGARSSIKDSALVTVTRNAQAIASLALQPGFVAVQPAGTATLAVTAKDPNGNTVPATGVVFVSRSPGVASVSAGGLVTGVSAGSAVVVASAGAVADSALVVVAASGSAVVSALAGSHAFATATSGDTVTVVVTADLRAVPAEALGSYNAALGWNPATLTYVSWSAVPGGFAAPTVNETQTASGALRFGSADPNGSSGQVALIQVKFVGAARASTTLALGLTDLSAAKTFTNLLPAAALVSGVVTVR